MTDSHVTPTPQATNPQRRLTTLYFSAVGGREGRALFEAAYAALKGRVDFLLVIYDGGDFQPPVDVKVICEPGWKWPLAMKYLHPDAVEQYDYLAVWDDDIDIADFDLDRMIELMEFNQLVLAQPSLRSPHWISHPILRQIEGTVGRFTDFVESMAPIFSRAGWNRFYPYLTEENTSGWGYDYAPIEPRGVIDCMHVVHTRAVRSCTAKSRAQLQAFHQLHGLSQYPAKCLGQLLDPRAV